MKIPGFAKRLSLFFTAVFIPVSLRQRIFLATCVIFALFHIATQYLRLPLILTAPLAASAVHFVLKRSLDRPIQALLHLTREGGFNLGFSNAPQISGRDEFSRVARAVFGMASRMRRSMLEARDQNAKVDEIFSAIGEGIVLVTLDGKILKTNNTVRRWLGFYGDVTGRELIDVLRNVELSKKVAELGHRIAASTALPYFEPEIIENLHLEGPESHKVRCKIVAVQTHVGETIFMIFLFDITDLHRLETFRKEFFANVSHELKTPLSAIRGYAELLSDNPIVSGDATCQNFIQVIERNALGLSTLIDQMLTLAGLEAGTLGLNIKPYDIREAAQQVMETLLPKARAAKVTLELDIATEIESLMADKARLDSVLLNLMDNGIKYNRTDGYVRLSVRQSPTQFLIFVEDSGQGLPDNAQLRAFERFYRVDKSHTRLGGGSGLGLAIVKHVVQGHGGNISLRSELGVGTVITVALPRYPTSSKIALSAPL